MANQSSFPHVQLDTKSAPSPANPSIKYVSRDSEMGKLMLSMDAQEKKELIPVVEAIFLSEYSLTKKVHALVDLVIERWRPGWIIKDGSLEVSIRNVWELLLEGQPATGTQTLRSLVASKFKPLQTMSTMHLRNSILLDSDIKLLFPYLRLSIIHTNKRRTFD